MHAEMIVLNDDPSFIERLEGTKRLGRGRLELEELTNDIVRFFRKVYIDSCVLLIHIINM